MKKYLLTSFVAGLLLIGGGCSPNRQTDQNSTSTTPASPTTTTTTSEVIPTSTPSLIDKPISEWPRYEFKELGFSIQLPFVSSSLDFGYSDCFTPVKTCDDRDVHNYGGIFYRNPNEMYPFMGSHTKNYGPDRDLNITDVQNLKLGTEPELFLLGDFLHGVKLHPTQRIILKGTEVIIFDANKDFGSTGIDDYDTKRWAFTFRTPTSRYFKSVIFTFSDKDLPFNKISQTVRSIIFK